MTTKLILIIIAFLNPQEKQAFEYYKTHINELYVEVGATVKERYTIIHNATGNEKPDFVMVVEFPDEQSFQKLFGSEDYKKLLPYRAKAFKKIDALISKKNE